MSMLNPKHWNLQAKLVIPPVLALLVVFVASGWFIQIQIQGVLDENEQTQFNLLSQMLQQQIDDQTRGMLSTMKLTAVQQSLYDGYFGAITDDFDFLKDFLRQTRTLANVGEVLVVESNGQVLLDAVSDERGRKVAYFNQLKPIFEHPPITDKATQLETAILSRVVQQDDGFLLLTAGPVLDVETVVAAVVFVTRLDLAFLQAQSEMLGAAVEVWIAAPDRIVASTLPELKLPQPLSSEQLAFDLDLNGAPYRNAANPLKGIDAYIGLAMDRSANASAHTRLSASLALAVVLAVTLVALLIWLNVRIIQRSVKELMCYAQNIAEGNLSIVVRQSGNDEIGHMAQSFSTMIESLGGIAQKLTTVISGLVGHSSNLSQTTETLALGALRQKEQTDSVATAMTEMSHVTDDVAKNATGAAQASEQVNTLAAQGADTVEKTVRGMARIAENVSESSDIMEVLGQRSNEIGEIITVIDDIANQTNLLALNAAIEAARAGESGRGFAVVADEVRQLAKRTSEATTEITSKISRIQKDTAKAVTSMSTGKEETEAGVLLVKQAQEAIAGIVETSARNAEMVLQIASAAEQQNITAAAVSQSLVNIAGVVSDSEQSSKAIRDAAQNLSETAVELEQAAAWFKVEHG